jgi:predicted ATPase
LWTGYEDSTLLSEFKSVSHLQGSSLGDMSLPLAVAQEIKSWQVFSLDPQDGLRAINEELRPDANLGPKGEKLASFLYTLKMRNPAQWETFQKALHLYIPEITAVEILLNQHNELELVVIENDKRISIRLMSDGTLALLGLLAIGSAKKHHGVIAIEEIETGIDPQKLDWVARYLEMQADVDRQFIVTTHSPHLLDFLSIESLYLCKKKNGKTSVVPVSTLPLIQKLDPEESLSDVILSGELHV